MIEWLELNLIALVNVIVIDVVLAGDNAIIVGLAASRVAPEARKRVIFWGMAGAVILRVLFAVVAQQLLAVVGFTLAGGILLLWVCWKMYRELGRKPHSPEGGAAGEALTIAPMSFRAATTQIVLAVAGAAKGSVWVLVIGLAVAIVLMAVAAGFIASLLASYPWITWIGLAIIVWVALDMIFSGTRQLACAAWQGAWCAPDLPSLIRGLVH